MRLLSLKVKEFKNLRNFEITFDPAEHITVLVGRNGSAKTNLIEAIILAFQDQESKRFPRFEYEATWLIRGEQVDVKASRKPNAKKITWDRQRHNNLGLEESQPNHVVCYYSGQSGRLNDLFLDYEDRYHSDSIKATENTLDLRKFILARPVHSQFVLLSFFLRPERTIDTFLRKTFKIEGIDSILFKLHKPRWAKKPNTYRNFWGATGYVNELTGRIRKFSLAPMALEERERITFSQTKTEENYYLFLPGREALTGLADLYLDAPSFFKALETLYLSEILSELRIRVKVRGVDGALSVRELSEGEQQLFTVLGLMRFTKDAESIYLLDEPDTHLNPAWGLHYMEFLRDIGLADEDSHTIIATHDPLVVAGLRKEQIRILYRDESGHVRAVQPDEDPKGKGVAAVLTSDLYGLESQLDLETQDLLEEKYELAFKERKTDADQVRLDYLNSKLTSVDAMQVIADPVYSAFAYQIYRALQDAKGLELSPDQVKERHKAIAQLLGVPEL